MFPGSVVPSSDFCSPVSNIYHFIVLSLQEFSSGQVNAGLECGIATNNFDDWAVGDIIEAFKRVEKRRTLEEASATMAAAIGKTQI